jgi:hypothetical protein
MLAAQSETFADLGGQLLAWREHCAERTAAARSAIAKRCKIGSESGRFAGFSAANQVAFQQWGMAAV